MVFKEVFNEDIDEDDYVNVRGIVLNCMLILRLKVLIRKNL